jgi:O-acetylhomoserine/O-acetylserine sulfhydrylase-like pyridoxal-dependent enzyme
VVIVADAAMATVADVVTAVTVAGGMAATTVAMAEVMTNPGSQCVYW